MTTNDVTPNRDNDIREWERVRRDYDYLPSVDSSTARDPEYTAARIQDIVDRVTRIGANVRAQFEEHPTIEGEQAERNAIARRLPEYLARFVEELRPFSRAGDAAHSHLTATYPHLHWTRVQGGFLGVFGWNAESDETESCALDLGLAKNEREDGRREWRGTYGEWGIRVVGDEKASTSAGEQ